MSNTEVSLRERKAAKLKLLILEVTRKKLASRNFQDIHVKEICEEVGISKVTFFRYFPQKEDVLLYYIRIWGFHITVELEQRNVSGLKAVRYIFEKFGEQCSRYPSLMLHVIKYYAESEKMPKPINIKKAEKIQLYPQKEGIEKLEVLAMDRLLEKHLLDAIFNTEVTKTSDVADMVRILMTVMYGSILVAKTKQLPVNVLLKKNIDSVINTF